MSTATFTTLGAPGGTIPTETIRRGTAKAWQLFNGRGTAAVLDSFNCSSLTDNGTGDFTTSFTTATANANYPYSGNALTNTGGAVQASWVLHGTGGAAATTNTLKSTTAIRTHGGLTNSTGVADLNDVSVVVDG